MRAEVARFYAITQRSWETFRSLMMECRADDCVLEIGCGAESYALCEIAPRVRWAGGVDISEVAVRASQQKVRQASLANTGFMRMDAESLAFPDNTFEAVLGTAVLHHLNLEGGYAQLARILKPTGRAIFLEPLGHNPIVNLYRRLTPELRTPDERPLRVGDIQLARRYFHSVKAHFFFLLALGAVLAHQQPFFAALLRRLNELDGWLFQHVPWTRRHAWIVVMELAHPYKSMQSPATRR